MARGNRNDTVDLMRGVSIALVLFLHFHLTYHLQRGFFAAFLPEDFLRSLFSNGNYGVVIFFVISGFLITRTSLNRYENLANLSLRNFYAFRAGRILPNILLMLLVIVPLSYVGPKIFQNDANGPSMGLTVLSVLTFTHNWLMEKFGYFNYCLNILWSLSVEEVFYLSFPLICLALKKPKYIAAAWASFLIVSPFYRHLHQNDAEDIYGLYDYLSCFDGLAIGCLVALAKRTMKIPTQLSYLIWPAVAIMIWIYLQGIWNHLVWGISGMSLLAGLILLCNCREIFSATVEKLTAPLRHLGQASYELYLFHIILLAFMRTYVKEKDLGFYQKPLWLVLFLLLSAIAAKWIGRNYSDPLNAKIRTRLIRAD